MLLWLLSLIDSMTEFFWWFKHRMLWKLYLRLLGTFWIGCFGSKNQKKVSVERYNFYLCLSIYLSDFYLLYECSFSWNFFGNSLKLPSSFRLWFSELWTSSFPAGFSVMFDCFSLAFFFNFFWQGDPLNIKVNKLSSTKTQLPYDYYFLKYCRPTKILNSAENLGEVLRGDRIENSVYSVRNFFLSNLIIAELKRRKSFPPNMCLWANLLSESILANCFTVSHETRTTMQSDL